MGACIHRQRDASDHGCLFFTSGYCDNSQASFYRCADYIASVSEDKIDISYSQIRDWDRCPALWAFKQIMGLTLREQYQSVNMRMGKELQRILANQKDVPPTYFSIDEQINLNIVYLFVEIIKERGLIPDGAQWEVERYRNGFHGILDVVTNEVTFGEIKFTGSPDFYLNNAIAWDQLEGYFYLDPAMRWGIMMPVRVPQLKDKSDESPEMKLQRIRVDINKRFNFYFPYYKADRKGIKWGQEHSVHQFRMQEFEEKFRWNKKEIKTACIYNYFVKRRSNCLSPSLCDFFSMCQGGGNINWELFEKRRPKGDEEGIEKSVDASELVEQLTK
jgi:hypothetical protein